MHCADPMTSLSVTLLSVGPVPKTARPVPVLAVSADERFADEGICSHAAAPAFKPEIPEIGKFVALARFTEDGVPSAPPGTRKNLTPPTGQAEHTLSIF